METFRWAYGLMLQFRTYGASGRTHLRIDCQTGERLRPRLMSLVGPNAPKELKSETWGVTRCWLDSKCIDQSSEDDKAYWVRRMDEVYFEARCTMLLLGPDCDLTPLLSLEREIKCEYRGRLKFT